MKTNDLIELMAHAAAPVPPGATMRRCGAALAAGIVLGAIGMQFEFGVNPQLRAFAGMPLFWVKVVFSALVVAAGLHATSRLSRPGASVKQVPRITLAPFAVLWLLAIAMLATAAPGEAESMIFGTTWHTCALNIATLSIPAFVAALWAMRGLAPTRPAYAGAAAGLLAGGIGSLVYTVHCPELMPPFIAIWYVGGILLPTAAGALAGPRLLRW